MGYLLRVDLPAADQTLPAGETVVIRVLLVDDQALVREGFARLLRDIEDIDVVGEAADGAAAVELAAALPGRCRPDGRPHAGDGRYPGHRASGRIGIRVLVLTTFDLDEAVAQALHAGASGFLLEDAPSTQLVHAIRVVANGDSVLAPTVTRRLIATVTKSAAFSEHDRSLLVRLTDREQEVLRLLAAGMSNARSARTSS